MVQTFHDRNRQSCSLLLEEKGTAIVHEDLFF